MDNDDQNNNINQKWSNHKEFTLSNTGFLKTSSTQQIHKDNSNSNNSSKHIKNEFRFSDSKMVFNLSDMLRTLQTDFVEIIEEMTSHLYNQSFVDRNAGDLKQSVERKI